MKVLVAGAGKLGAKTAQALVRENMDVTIIDKNENVIAALSERMDVLTVTANALDFSVYKELDISTYDLLIAATDSDEANTIVCTAAKKLGCKQTIARIRNPQYLAEIKFIKEALGITYVINPEYFTANSITKYLLKAYSKGVGDFAKGKVHMIDFAINTHHELTGRMISDLPLMENLVITAISRHGTIIIPDGSTVLETEDVVHIMGQSSDIEAFQRHFHDSVFTEKRPQKVMIIGGGRVGLYLTRNLIKENIEVTLVEQSMKRCEELIEHLGSGCLVIHGDGTDLKLLQEEGIEYMDAFVATTGMDEVNLLMASIAKQEGVGRAVAKVSRSNYEGMIDRLSLDAAFNPIYITASNILKAIRGGRAVSVTLLLGGEAEVTEVVLHPKAIVVGMRIMDLNLPKGIIIGVIIRDGEVIIPKGETVLMGEDGLVLFCLTENLPTLKKFFIYQQKVKEGGLINELRRIHKGDW
ncbi:MAG: Trk system potassium transporter TrkA [Tissierellia bacterium]|nr:Trk system potassium transporter TrkA [Tissierellia bacterium]